MCMYLHKVENKGKNMKASKATSERDEDSEKEKVAQSKNSLDEERDTHLTGDNDITYLGRVDQTRHAVIQLQVL